MNQQNSAPQPYRHAGWAGQIGIARGEITPPVGIYSRTWGAAEHDVAESVHRPLSLTALVLQPAEAEPAERSAEPLVLIDADLGWWKSLEVFQELRQRLLDSLGLSSSQLIFALTHSHAAPPLMRADASLPGSELHGQWLDQLVTVAMATVRQARQQLFAGVLEWAAGHCGLAAGRDLPDPQPGSERLVCGFNPDQPADTTLIVGRVADTTGQLRGTLVHYACHPTTLAWENRAISPDYPGAMREVVQQATAAPCLFLLGACGELAPRHQYVGDSAVPDQHGRQLGHAALSVLYGMNPPQTELAYQGTVESGAPLAVWRPQPKSMNRRLRGWQATVRLPLKQWPSAEQLEQQRLQATDRFQEERLRRQRDIRRVLGDGADYPLELTIWQIGDAFWVGNCCEAYSLLQSELRRRFPQLTLICMNLINGSLGYLPPADLYDHDVYPVWQTPFDRGSLELTIDEYERQIRQSG